MTQVGREIDHDRTLESPAPVLPPAPPSRRAPITFPSEWTCEVPPTPARERDIALDLIRGLAMVILLFNHTAIDSGIERLSGSVISGAEVLVMVSGVIVGLVFGGRWQRLGPRATSLLLLRRARKLYLASVVVVALVGALTLVPGLDTDALVASSKSYLTGSYDFASFPRTLVAVVTLESGPWQFNILGFFITAIAISPLVLWLLDRGRWPLVAVGSIALYLIDVSFDPDLLPFQSERPFPFLTWQILFVGGMLVGWHRAGLASGLGRMRRPLMAVIGTIALISAVALAAAHLSMTDDAWKAWERSHFDKASLDLGRILVMASLAFGLYWLARRYQDLLRWAAAPLLLPLGQNSFYVFIVHVFWCLAVASVPILAGGGLGLVGNTVIELAGLLVIWVMVRQRFLFRWIPR